MVKENSAYLETMYSGKSQVDPYTHRLASLISREITEFRGRDDESATLLDLGCGKGFQSEALSAYFAVAACDRDTSCQNYFQAKGLNIPVARCDLGRERLPYEDTKFDIVFHKSVIEHLENPLDFLAEIHRVLKSDGVMVVLTPSWVSQMNCFYDDPTHIRPFTERGLAKALKMTGFARVEVREFYQLPFIWAYPWLKFVPQLVSFLPDGMKWNSRDTHNTFVRFSKEKMLLGFAQK